MRERLARVCLRWADQPQHVCHSCGCSKQHWCGLVADAGQFFEATSASQAAAAMDWLRSELLARQAPMDLTILKAPRR
eukprot:1988557-Alexandrium_andersonii.AAC.1